MDRRYLAVSAQQLDPLTWFTGRVVPLVFALLVALYAAFRVPTWFTTSATAAPGGRATFSSAAARASSKAVAVAWARR